MSIFVSVKRLFKHSAVYGMGHILNRLIIFLLIPLYTNIFAQAALGVYTLVFSYVAILTIIYSYGLDTAFFRFYILDDTQQGRNKVFSTAFISIILTSALFSLVIYLFKQPISENVYVFSQEIQQLDINLFGRIVCRNFVFRFCAAHAVSYFAC